MCRLNQFFHFSKPVCGITLIRGTTILSEYKILIELSILSVLGEHRNAEEIEEAGHLCHVCC